MYRSFFRAWLLVATGLAFAVAPAGVAYADFIEGPVKWSQPIGFIPGGPITGGDILSDHGNGSHFSFLQIMADDFLSDGRPIVAVRWWGSYIGEGQQRADGFTVFDLAFYLSVGDHPNSLPSMFAEEEYSLTAQEVFVGVDEFGDLVYRYDAFLPQPFLEQAGTEYFLAIDKPNTGENWGWHEAGADSPVLDYAATKPCHGACHPVAWSTHPDQTDLAFELITMAEVPEPTSAALFGMGVIGLALGLGRRWLRK